MGQLVRGGLVQQVIPANHIRNEQKFAEPFLKYVEKRLPIVRKYSLTNAHFRATSSECVRIHIEKIGIIAPELQRMGLLRSIDYSWHLVPSWVGIAYMAYLATCLGLDETIEAQPANACKAITGLNSSGAAFSSRTSSSGE